MILKTENKLKEIHKKDFTFQFLENINVLCTPLHQISKPINYCFGIKNNEFLWRSDDIYQKRFEFWFDKFSFNRIDPCK